MLEGDIVLCAGGRAPLAGDIVLIEEDGRERLGVLAEPGFLETRSGSRPIEASERITAVGVALAVLLAMATVLKIEELAVAMRRILSRFDRSAP